MAVLSPLQIAASASKAGFPATEIPTAVAVAYAESGGNPAAIGGPNSNGSFDYGLFQINDVHKALLASGSWSDPDANAKMAFSVWQGSGWKAWSAYNNGRYKSVPKDYQGVTGTVPNTGGAATPTVEPALSLPNPISGITDFLGRLFDVNLWKRLGLGILGVGLVIIGLVFLFRDQATDAVTKVVGKVVKA